jgi:epoxyqueuosine reductase
MSGPAERSATVKARARALGFDAVGICDLAPIDRDALRTWLGAGHGAGMHYMQRQAAKRQEPARIVPGARSAVVVLKGYFAAHPASAPAGVRVARYAWGDDYHDVLGAMLGPLAETVIALGGTRESTRGYVDAGPVPERELAQRAGLGWIAKNTMLIHPRLGSFTFIAAVLTDLELAVDQPFVADHCGRCQACLDACPTGAFPRPRVLDARRCISYLTIEHRGSFSAGDGEKIGEWLFGCDVCQDACPWNDKFAAPTDAPRLTPRPELVAPDLETLGGVDDAAFRARYAGTAFERAGSAGMARNATQVIANRRRPGQSIRLGAI